MREEALRCFRIGEFQGTEEETGCFKLQLYLPPCARRARVLATEPPYKTGTIVGEAVDGFELVNERLDSWVVQRCDESSDINLGQLMTLHSAILPVQFPSAKIDSCHPQIDV